MPLTTLVTTADLAPRLDDPSWVVVDCRFALDDTEWGRREYLGSHIPGAVYAHLDADLSGAKTGTNGRHPLPEPEALRESLSRLGIDGTMQVVAYDEGTGMYASRLWWLLRWMGHTAVAVLDGGMAKWNAEGRPTTSGEETRSRREFAGVPRAEMTVDAEAVGMLATARDWSIVDARAPERYRGEVEPIDRVPGHIPGAINHFYKSNLDSDGVFRTSEALRQMLGEVVGPVQADHIVSYCGSGVTGCHTLLALEHAGMHGAKLYPGSWSEWSADPSRPVERGPGRASK